MSSVKCWTKSIGTKIRKNQSSCAFHLSRQNDEIAEQHQLNLLARTVLWHDYIREICQEEFNKKSSTEPMNLFLKPEGKYWLLLLLLLHHHRRFTFFFQVYVNCQQMWLNTRQRTGKLHDRNGTIVCSSLVVVRSCMSHNIIQK